MKWVSAITYGCRFGATHMRMLGSVGMGMPARNAWNAMVTVLGPLLSNVLGVGRLRRAHRRG